MENPEIGRILRIVQGIVQAKPKEVGFEKLMKKKLFPTTEATTVAGTRLAKIVKRNVDETVTTTTGSETHMTSKIERNQTVSSTKPTETTTTTKFPLKRNVRCAEKSCAKAKTLALSSVKIEPPADNSSDADIPIRIVKSTTVETSSKPTGSSLTTLAGLKRVNLIKKLTENATTSTTSRPQTTLFRSTVDPLENFNLSEPLGGGFREEATHFDDNVFRAMAGWIFDRELNKSKQVDHGNLDTNPLNSVFHLELPRDTFAQSVSEIADRLVDYEKNNNSKNVILFLIFVDLLSL